jgi:predicted P-loop ATPase
MNALQDIEAASFPPELLTRQQWLVWRFVQKPDQKKPSKMPFYASGVVRTGQQGSEQDRNALVDYHTAVAAMTSGEYDGLGFAFLPGDGLIGIDIDGALQDDAPPEKRERAKRIIQACASYTEYSPSGNGVHIIVNGFTETFKSNELGIEVFCGRQFFTMSGNPYPGTVGEVRQISLETLDKLRNTVKQQATQAPTKPIPQPPASERTKLESALVFIHPDCGYEDWIRVGMAIHAELGDQGLAVWDWWSARGGKYPGQREIEMHWRSFKPGAITGGTIYHMAQAAGWRPPRPTVVPAVKPTTTAVTPANDNQPEPLQHGGDYALEVNSKGEPYPTVANITRVLNADPVLAKTIWFDEFLQRVVTAWRRSEPTEWADVDDVNLLIYLQESLRLPKLAKSTVQDAITATAHQDVRNEAKAYLDSVKWDGVERLPMFFPDYFGTDNTEYTQRCGVNFWVSMVARVMRPGCKVDNMVVLEGPQGTGKSSALAIIGGKWFTEAHRSPTDKDFFVELEGKMLVEIGEMDAFSRAEVNKTKQVITCQTDRYRAPYDRRAADHPRRCVFAGTTNRDDWNKDETGARRFWPIYCTDIDHSNLALQRDQLFAEAVHRLNQGERWWEMPISATKAQQEARRDADELESVLEDWLIGRGEVTVGAVMNDLMKVPLDRQDKQLQMRIGKALRAIGWVKSSAPVYRGGRNVRVWTKRGGEKQQGGEEQPF